MKVRGLGASKSQLEREIDEYTCQMILKAKWLSVCCFQQNDFDSFVFRQGQIRQMQE